MMNGVALNNLSALCQRYAGGRGFSGGGVDDATRPFGGMMRGFGSGVDGGFPVMGGYGSWIGLIGHGIFSLVLLALAIALIVWLVRLAKRAGTPVHPAGFVQPGASEAASALNLLNDRYVKGEIAEEEYLKIKKNLTE